MDNEVECNIKIVNILNLTYKAYTPIFTKVCKVCCINLFPINFKVLDKKVSCHLAGVELENQFHLFIFFTNN